MLIYSAFPAAQGGAAIFGRAKRLKMKKTDNRRFPFSCAEKARMAFFSKPVGLPRRHLNTQRLIQQPMQWTENIPVKVESCFGALPSPFRRIFSGGISVDWLDPT